MFNSQLVCLFLACVIVLVHSGASINGVDAAFKTARWIRPTADSEQGDRRYLMQKYMKKIVKDAREEDPLPPDGSVSTRSGRSGPRVALGCGQWNGVWDWEVSDLATRTVHGRA